MGSPNTHRFTTFLSGGKSLHPLQRQGSVPTAGFQVQPAGGQPGLQDAQKGVPPTNLILPPMQNVTILNALNPGNVS